MAGFMGGYDVVVIGGGHAGAEAGAAAARLGCRTLLVTPDLGRIGQMSCNPAIGGVAKGTVAREIDALGGIMGRATDASTLHFRMLNQSKGPAVWGPRAQCDRTLYARAILGLLEATPGLDLLQGVVDDVVVEGGGVAGVRLAGGIDLPSRAVVVTAGTFLRGRIHRGGEESRSGGRAGEGAVESLSGSLEGAGVELRRFKTGTPPRIDGRTVDYDRMEEQGSESDDFRFSFWGGDGRPGTRPCWLTWTGEPLRRIVAAHMEESAIYGGELSGRGPRYCPSIEDKILRFPEAPRHKVFLEPEGLDTTELYVNGLSTSLPPEVQLAFLRSIPGLENARITRLGYAIEYDYLPPEQLRGTLEVRGVRGLFTAGQVNGTTGYEEAAGQGIVAGINAGLQVQGRDPWTPSRASSYLGVMVDDLVTRGVDEPYRLFTSRAEFRILLRQDNAPERLSVEAEALGLLGEDALRAWRDRVRAREAWVGWMGGASVLPEPSSGVLEGAGTPRLRERTPVEEVARRPQVDLPVMKALDHAGALVPPPPGGGGEGEMSGLDEVHEGVLLDARYAGYREREARRVARFERLRSRPIPDAFDFEGCHVLSFEARQQLARVRPETVAQAAQVRGVRPADVENLVLALGRWKKEEASPGGPAETEKARGR